jgi:nucleoside 2-deoxyribosyltransferase
MNVKYQIFVSSTYEDLKDERNEVIKACLNMGHIPVGMEMFNPVGMEMFNAADEEQWAVITRTIDQCDYYVVILAHRYGSMVDGTSFTEKEYDYAVAQGVPALGFVIDDGRRGRMTSSTRTMWRSRRCSVSSSR